MWSKIGKCVILRATGKPNQRISECSKKLLSCLAGLRSSSSFATALASMPMVDSLSINFLSKISTNLGGALEWDCSPETESRTVVQPFSTTPATRDNNCLGAYVYHYSTKKIKKWILFVTYIYYWVVYSWHHSLHSSKSCHRRKHVLHWLLTCMTNIPSSRRKSNCSSLCCNIFSRWAEICPAPAKPLT